MSSIYEQGASNLMEDSGAKRLQSVRFGEYLCVRNMITDEQLLAALGDHWSNGGSIGAAICRNGFLAPDEVERAAAEYHALDTVEV